MTEPLRLTAQQGHLIHTSDYDQDLNLIASSVAPAPGYQMNGHRADCRCEPCRPDIIRLPGGQP